MGVYIPTAEMPHNLLECFYGEQCQEYEDCNGLERGKKCPLINIDLVRCRECKYWHEGEWYNTCDKHIGHGFMAEHFCSYGERRADE